ncbi:MAG TPA: hypothetical protein VEU52_05375 [Candidatus Limnocylindrales bacterium]|nr:hypothetical protein [Candidatus Limnocylindrales bacterium]
MFTTANPKISPKVTPSAASCNSFQFCNLHFAQLFCRAETLPLQYDTPSFAFSSGEEKVNRNTRSLTRPLTSFQSNHLTFSNRNKFAFSEMAENSCSTRAASVGARGLCALENTAGRALAPCASTEGTLLVFFRHLATRHSLALTPLCGATVWGLNLPLALVSSLFFQALGGLGAARGEARGGGKRMRLSWKFGGQAPPATGANENADEPEGISGRARSAGA